MRLLSPAILLLIVSIGKGSKDGGSIDDLFSKSGDREFRSHDNADLKKQIGITPEEVGKCLKELEKDIEKKLRHYKSHPIPETTFEKLLNNGGKLPDRIVPKIRQRGVVIVRNTVPRNLIHSWSGELIQYLYNNNAFPKESNQTVYETYWSKPQVAARQHPNIHMVQKALLSLWHTSGDSAVDVDLEKPLTYVDRLRIRQPNDSIFNLPPHVDGGGIERWKDNTYRQVYRHILEGNWRDYDPFEVDYRVEANMNEAGYSNGCTFFRAFQGLCIHLSPLSNVLSDHSKTTQFYYRIRQNENTFQTMSAN